MAKEPLLRPRVALAGAENLEGQSAKAMGDQGTLETPGEQGDAGGGVPHCPAFYRFSKHIQNELVLNHNTSRKLHSK